MKKALFLLAVGLCLVAVAVAAPDFSGTWTLNAAKSDQGGQGGASGARSGGGERTGAAPSGGGERSGTPPSGGGERSGATGGASASRGGTGSGGAGGSSEMTVKITGKEMIVTQGTQETKYILDGTAQTATSRGGELKYKGSLAGNVITIDGTRGDAKYKLTYELSADGKTLTRTSTSGETTRKMVYDKK
jgi:hypothetical protein